MRHLINITTILHKLIKKNITLLFFVFGVLNLFSFAYGENDNLLQPIEDIEIHNEYKPNPDSNYFNLANIVDTFLNNETKPQEDIADKKAKIRRDFISTTQKFNQGNISVAYDEYEKLIQKIDNDTSLLALSKIFYEIGFFSLGDKAIEKIIYKNQFYENINNLEKSYKPKTQLTKEEEIYFAKLYSGIYFENTAQEAINELITNQEKFQKNDFAQYNLARANLELKKYNQAINSINKAITLNPNNVSYQIFKINTLINSRKYNDAQKLIEKLEKTKLTVDFVNEIEILKQTVLANTTKDEKEKKYYIAKKSFLEGNFEKTKKDCQNILNFDKENDKIMALYAKSELALGNVERANVYFINSYKENKNNTETLIGLGDIRYIHGDYKNSVKMYKKAISKEKNNYEIILKLAVSQRQYAKNPKELQKLEQQLDKMPQNEYLAYYNSAISIAQKNDILKEDFLKKALTINPMYEKALGEPIELYLKNKSYELAKGLIYNASFTLEKNYYYYYLCGIYNQAINKNKDAIQFYKTSLNLNPNFEIANTKLLKLIPNSEQEEI